MTIASANTDKPLAEKKLSVRLLLYSLTPYMVLFGEQVESTEL